MQTLVRFGTKAETLERLSGRLRTATVLPLDYFTVRDWEDDPDAILDRVCARPWARSTLIVRSSAQSEDTDSASNAGCYLSRAHVHGREAVRAAVEDVIASFGDASADDQVLIQPELRGVVASGVAASRDPSGGPYRVINWAAGDDTAAVTAGRDRTRTWYCLSYEQHPPPCPELGGLPAVLDEMEQLVGRRPFELEFGVIGADSLVLFQARPMASSGDPVSPRRHRAAVAACQAKLREMSRERAPALGPEVAFGVMPDWNPAEMIGVRPRPLALSLYTSLITDEAWAESRARYGYRDVRGTPLIVDFEGLPYVDTRASFTSLVPAELDDELARRLVGHYVRTLRANPHQHDKVEFEIALTAYDFDVPERVRRLVAAGVVTRSQGDRLIEALRRLTTAMTAPAGPWARDLATIAGLGDIDVSAVGDRAAGDAGIAALADLCRRRGTLPFAGLARAAFVAVSIVRSLVRRSVLTREEAGDLLGCANEVTRRMRRDLAEQDRERFLRRYGHLRPGTYDIISPRYDECADRYFDWTAAAPDESDLPEFAPTAGQLEQIDKLALTHGLEPNADELLTFIRGAVAARESAKFEFSRVVSELLLRARAVGERWGFSADDISFVPIAELLSLTGGDAVDRRALAAAVRAGRERHRITETLRAPALLWSASSFESFVTLDDQPNFVTEARVVAPVADVEAGDPPNGAIAMIASADPGYDWIFAHDVAGLITAYGGANSHMALRALELGIPAAIGVGEPRFRRWLAEGVLELDAGSRLVRAPVTAAARPVANLFTAREGT